MDINEEIIKIFNNLGIEEVGFVKIEYFKDLEEILIKQKEMCYSTPFQKGDIEAKVFKNTSPFNSAIVCLIPYQKNELNLDKKYVYVSSSSWGRDYHIALKEKLSKVEDYLIGNGYSAKICVDNNELDERYLAYKAGLGFYGLNNLLINDTYGSYTFIGVILTDAIFEYSVVLNKKCFMCKKCVESCPSGAINRSGILNGGKCLSYITQKKYLNNGEEEFINQCIYGCDVCSQVCPHNKDIKENNNFLLDDEVIIDINEYKKLSNREFKSRYGKYAFSWRGKNVFERNIDIYKQKVENK